MSHAGGKQELDKFGAVKSFGLQRGSTLYTLLVTGYFRFGCEPGTVLRDECVARRALDIDSWHAQAGSGLRSGASTRSRTRKIGARPATFFVISPAARLRETLREAPHTLERRSERGRSEKRRFLGGSGGSGSGKRRAYAATWLPSAAIENSRSRRHGGACEKKRKIKSMTDRPQRRSTKPLAAAAALGLANVRCGPLCAQAKPHAQDAPLCEHDNPALFNEMLRTVSTVAIEPQRAYVYPATSAQEIGWLRSTRRFGGPAKKNTIDDEEKSWARRHCDVVHYFKDSAPRGR